MNFRSLLARHRQVRLPKMTSPRNHHPLPLGSNFDSDAAASGTRFRVAARLRRALNDCPPQREKGARRDERPAMEHEALRASQPREGCEHERSSAAAGGLAAGVATNAVAPFGPSTDNVTVVVALPAMRAALARRASNRAQQNAPVPC